MRLLPLLATIAALALGPAGAQEARRVNVDVSDVPLAGVLVDVARQADASLVVDPNVTAVVTASLHEAPWRDAIDALARQGGCEVQETGGVLVVSRATRRSATLADVDVREALARLSSPGDAWWIDPRLTARVSVDVKDATWTDAVAAVAAAAGAKVTIVDGCALVGVDVGVSSSRRSLAARFPDSPRVTAVVTGGDLKPLFAAVAAITNHTAVAVGRSTQAVSATFHDVPWAEALDAVLRVIAYDANVDAQGGLRAVARKLCAQEATEPVSTRAVLSSVARSNGASFLLGPGVAGAQRQAFRALPCDLAQRLIVLGAGLRESRDGDVLIVDDVVHEGAPAGGGGQDGPVFELQAEGAEARPWIELLATVGALPLEVAPEVQGEVTALLRGMSARRALELTARVNGYTLVEKDGALQLGGAGRPAPAKIPAAAPAEGETPRATPAASYDPALREQLSAKITQLLATAEPAAANEALAAIDTLLARAGGPEAARAAMKLHEQPLAERGEARQTLLLKVQEAEATALLQGMTEALAQERLADVQPLAVRFGELLSAMQAQGLEVFTNKAQRLRAKALTLQDKAERLERLGRLDLRVSAVAFGAAPADHAAVINGAVLRAGERVPGSFGAMLDVDVFSIENGFVYVRFEGFSFARRLQR